MTQDQANFIFICLIGMLVMVAILGFLTWMDDISQLPPKSNKRLMKELDRHRGNEDDSDSHS